MDRAGLMSRRSIPDRLVLAPKWHGGPAAVAVEASPGSSGRGLSPDRARVRMIEALRSGGVRDPDVLAALGAVPRHLFVEAGLASRAYDDTSLPIGHEQTISKPSTVARMLEIACAHLAVVRRRQARALEVGTGCGYQAAVMAQVFAEVVTIERLKPLHEQARSNLRPMRLSNVRLAFGDGRLGVPQSAPYDVVLVAAAGEAIADELLLQMAVGGRLVAPVTGPKGGGQSLHLVERVGQNDWHLTVLDAVRFVPLKSGTR